MTSAFGIAQVLGGRSALGRDVSSLRDLLELVRVGLPFAALQALMDIYDLTQETVSPLLGLSTRTLPRKRATGRLSPEQSDRLYRLARVIAHAIEVLEDPHRVSEWLRSPNRALGKEDPLSLLDTDIGVQEVDRVLGRIEHGVVH